MKDKILFLSNLFPRPWDTGQATFNRQHVEHLKDYYKIDVLVPVYWIEWIKHRNNKKKLRMEGVDVKYFISFYIPGLARSLNAFFMYISILIQKWTWIKRNNYKIIILSWAYPDAVAGTLISRMLNIPTVIKIHGSDINVQSKFILRWLQMKWAFKRTKKIVSVSNALKNTLVEKGIPRKNIEVVYNGVDNKKFKNMERSLARNRLGLSGKGEIILYIGNLKVTKGVYDLFYAYERVKKSFPDLVLYYIGAGEEFNKLNKLVSETGMDSKIKLLGAVSHEKLATWFCAANVFCLPSYNEGLPNVILEAMACGTATVATRVGGIPEILDDTVGVLVEPGDITDLAKGIKKSLAIEWNSIEISEKISKFSWKKNAMETHKLIQNSMNLK